MASASRVSWSLLPYDVPTVIDILGLPCRLRLADDNFAESLHGRRETQEHGQHSGVEFTLKKETTVYSVRARVLEFEDPDWVEGSGMGQVVLERRRHVGKEFCIPLDYSGRVRLADTTEGREYFNVKEIMATGNEEEGTDQRANYAPFDLGLHWSPYDNLFTDVPLVADFPRRVVVLQDAICSSTGNKAFHVVLSGTVLELDRVTKSNKMSRGTRETYLICHDRYNNRELAFQNLSFIHFRKVADRTSYELNDFINKIPLPQTVEFVNVNPYDVVDVDDDNARELLTILSGPVELKEVCRSHFFVGFVERPYGDRCYTVAIPKEIAPNLLVHMPISCIREQSEQTFTEKPALETNTGAKSNCQNGHGSYNAHLQYADKNKVQYGPDFNLGAVNDGLLTSSHDVIPGTRCDTSFMNYRRSPEVISKSREVSPMDAAPYYDTVYSHCNRPNIDGRLTVRHGEDSLGICGCYSNSSVLPDTIIHCDHFKDGIRQDTNDTSYLWKNTNCTAETDISNGQTNLSLYSTTVLPDPTNCTLQEDCNDTTVQMDDSLTRTANSTYICGSIAAIGGALPEGGGDSPEVDNMTTNFGIRSPEVTYSSPDFDSIPLNFVNSLDFFRDSRSDCESKVSHGHTVDRLAVGLPDIDGAIPNIEYSCDILNKKLYMFSDSREKPILLRRVVQDEEYLTEERPATPPLPPKLACYNHTLKYRLSDSMATHGDEEDTPHFKKKSSSMGDIQASKGTPRNYSLPRNESWGFKNYLSQFSMKLKSSASQILFGVDMHSDKRALIKRPSCRSAVSDVTVYENNSVLGSGFTCYINAHDEEKARETARYRSVSDANDRHSNHFMKDEVIYTSVDWSKKGPAFQCVVCQMNYKTLNNS